MTSVLRLRKLGIREESLSEGSWLASVGGGVRGLVICWLLQKSLVNYLALHCAFR